MGAREGQGKFYAYVEGISLPTPDQTNYMRLHLTLDCVDARSSNEGREPTDDELVIVRVISTPKRLMRHFNLTRTPKEGDWFLIELNTKEGEPLAWTLSATNDYRGDPVRTNLVGFWFIDPEASTPHELGPEKREDAELLSVVTGSLLSKRYQPRDMGSGDDWVSLLAVATHGGPDTLSARVLDVGQASCTAIYTARDPAAEVLGFFDVGAPIWFHNKSMPRQLDLKLPKTKGFVVLSHWDFDHYAMAWWRVKKLRDLSWFAPLQPVGANGARFQNLLGDRLHFCHEEQIGVDRFTLFKGRGAAHGLDTDRNATGYVLRLTNEDGARLLTGDVDYSYVPGLAMEQLVGLTVPHHGGTGTGTPPTPSKHGALAVASYGVPNRYRHPDEAYLQSHQRAGWAVARTATHASRLRRSHWL